MKHFQLYFLAAILTLAFTTTQAQSDPKADKILKESKAKFNSLSDISASFDYRLDNPNLNNPITKKGTVKIKKNKFQIKFTDEEFYCDGNTVWVSLTEDQEITLTNFDPEESMSVERIYDIYEENTRSKYDGEQNGNHKITLFMLDKESDIWKVEVWVSKSTKLTQKAIMYGRNGSKYNYDLKNIATNKGIADSQFVLDHKAKEQQGWYINDLR